LTNLIFHQKLLSKTGAEDYFRLRDARASFYEKERKLSDSL